MWKNPLCTQKTTQNMGDTQHIRKLMTFETLSPSYDTEITRTAITIPLGGNLEDCLRIKVRRMLNRTLQYVFIVTNSRVERRFMRDVRLTFMFMQAYQTRIWWRHLLVPAIMQHLQFIQNYEKNNKRCSPHFYDIPNSDIFYSLTFHGLYSHVLNAHLKVVDILYFD
jgi:hypothetical protein